MMLRYAAVRPDGSIARVVTGSSEAAIDMNMPAGTIKIVAPDDVRFGSHSYDLNAEEFRRITGEQQSLL